MIQYKFIDMSEDLHSTLLNMKTMLKSKEENMFFDLNTPIKRRLSDPDSNITPIKKFKESIDPNATYVGSPREIRRIRADLLETRNTIRSLEDRIQNLHTVRKQMEITFDNETKCLKSQRDRDMKSIEELENQLQSIRKREIENQAALAEAKSKYDKFKVSMDIKVEDIEKKLSDLSEEKVNQEDNGNTEINLLKRDNEKLKDLYEAAVEDTNSHKKLVDELQNQLSEKNATERDVLLKEQALQKAKIQIKDLEFARDSYAEFQEQSKLQQHKLSSYNDLESENNKLKEEVCKLKEEVRNKLILEEEVYDLRSRLSNYKENENKLSTIQVLFAQAELDLEEWKTIGRNVCEGNPPDSALPRLLRNLVERLQQQEINLTSELMQLKSEKNTNSHENQQSRADLEKAAKRASDLQSDALQRQQLIHRIQKKLLLVSRERDSYRTQLDSYERDLTITVAPPSSSSSHNASVAHTVLQVQQQRERIANLESVVDGYRDMVSKLESDLQSAQPGLHVDVASVRMDQLRRLQEDMEKLKYENGLLRDRKDQLEMKLEEMVVGQDNMLTGKVYHYTNNPLAECIAEDRMDKEKLVEEVTRLKCKIRNLEDGLEASTLADISLCPKEIASLREQIKLGEVRETKLKEFCKMSMNQLREICYILFGFKIDRISSVQYKLTSIYAQNEDDYLLFHVNEETELNLMETSFSASLTNMIESYLLQQKSIPVFLSAVTIDLFNAHTQSVFINNLQ